MKVQTIRSLLWVGNLAVIVAIGALLVKVYLDNRQKGPAKLFGYLEAEKIQAAADVPRIEVGDGSSPAQHWPLYAATYSLNVTGKEPPKPIEAAEGPEEKIPDLKPITDVLRIDLLYYAGPDSSKARIRYLEDGPNGIRPPANNPTRAVLGNVLQRAEARVSKDFVVAGDELRAPWNGKPFLGKVKEITPDGIVFSWGGDDVLLQPGEMARLADGDVKTMPGLDEPKLSDEELARRMAEARETRQVGEHGWFIGTEELDRLEEEHDRLLAEVEVGMKYDAGSQRALLQINEIPEGSLVAQRGFEKGDVLLSINGEPISSKYAAIQYFRQNSNSTKFNVEIERRGTRITKVFETAR